MKTKRKNVGEKEQPLDPGRDQLQTENSHEDNKKKPHTWTPNRVFIHLPKHRKQQQQKLIH